MRVEGREPEGSGPRSGQIRLRAVERVYADFIHGSSLRLQRPQRIIETHQLVATPSTARNHAEQCKTDEKRGRLWNGDRIGYEHSCGAIGKSGEKCDLAEIVKCRLPAVFVGSI